MMKRLIKTSMIFKILKYIMNKRLNLKNNNLSKFN